LLWTVDGIMAARGGPSLVDRVIDARVRSPSRGRLKAAVYFGAAALFLSIAIGTWRP
jgi:hypothetical protein